MVKFHVCNAVDLVEGEMKSFTVDDKEILIAKSSGKLFCLEGRCPHRDAPLCDGFLEAEKITCPFHAASFDLQTGKASFAMPLPDLKTFQVSVEDEKVLVDL